MNQWPAIIFINNKPSLHPKLHTSPHTSTEEKKIVASVAVTWNYKLNRDQHIIIIIIIIIILLFFFVIIVLGLKVILKLQGAVYNLPVKPFEVNPAIKFHTTVTLVLVSKPWKGII